MIETTETADSADVLYPLATRNLLVAGVIILLLCQSAASFGEKGTSAFWFAVLLDLIIGLALPTYLWNVPHGLGINFGPGVPVSRFKTVLVALPLMIVLRMAILPLELLLDNVLGLPNPDISKFHLEPGNIGRLIPFIFWGCLFAPVVEELIFRGYLLSELRRLMSGLMNGQWPALIFTSLLFGLLHWPMQGLGAVCSAFLFGLGLSAIYIKSGNNLLLVITIHGLSNLVSGLINFSGP
jgi:membrane protease YdiL (CAAX protease family)